jgi:hypothetical protein
MHNLSSTGVLELHPSSCPMMQFPAGPLLLTHYGHKIVSQSPSEPILNFDDGRKNAVVMPCFIEPLNDLCGSISR